MLNRNNKKLVSILTAAMMLTSFAAPSVMAEDEAYTGAVSIEEIAMLDEAEAITANDFENEEEGVLISVPMGTEDPAPYTDLAPFSISVGYNRRKADADTNASIASGVGKDGSKALALVYDGDLATAGAEFDIIIPEGTESYKISFDVFPTNAQDLVAILPGEVNEDTGEASEIKESLGLVPDTWNFIEIYVTSEGRILNVNDLETFINDSETVIPAFSGIKTKGTGSVYIDNISISALDVLPEPIPDVKIGTSFDFEEYPTNTGVTFKTTATPAFEDVKGFVFYIGSRDSGGDETSRVRIEDKAGVNDSKGICVNYANWTDVNRGPRIALINPAEENYIVSFQVKGDGSQAMIFAGSSSDSTGTEIALPNRWVPVQIVMLDGVRTTYVNGAVVESVEATSLPVIWGKNARYTGAFYIDEYKVTEVDLNGVVDSVAAALDVASDTYADRIVYDAVNERYDVTGSFAVLVDGGLVNIEWSSDDETLAKVGADGKVAVTPKEGATVTLHAVVSKGDHSQPKSFTLNLDSYYKKVEDLVTAEVEATTVSPKGALGENVTTMVLDPENATTVSYDIALPTVSTQKGVTIKWATSNEDIITKDGVINVDNMDANEVTLTKTVTYSENGKKLSETSKDYKINVEFNPETVKPAAEELAKAYALASDAELTEEDYAKSTYYKSAMEMLYDRYVARFDANYAKNFADIPDEVDDDFDLPTEGAFGSEISWTSSITNVKINNKGEATVTRSSNDKTAKLSATFTSGAAINADAKTVEVVVEGKGGSGGGGGRGSSNYGGGNTYIGSLGAITSTPAPTVVTPAEDVNVKGEFTDLGDASWAAVAINYLADKGIVSGRTSTTFAPNDNITRAEFAKILVGAFELPSVVASAGFADVADDAWYASYVNTCFAAGIITGYDSTTFGPNDLVTRQDMAVMVMRAATLKGVTVEAVNAKVDFADADQIGAYAVEAVTTLQQGGIINGMTADTFAPTANATRAQAAKILYGFCN